MATWTDWTLTTNAFSNAVSGYAWANPGNAEADDGTTSSSYLKVAASTSNYLACVEFGFDAVIPEDATITGIEVEVDGRYASVASSVTDLLIKLRKNDGTEVGDNKASGTYWPTGAADATYGGTGDDWNASLTAADVRSAGFGINIQGQNALATTYAYVDAVYMRVEYEEAPPEASQVIFF